MKLQEEFDRERERLVRERHEIKMAGGVAVGGVTTVAFGGIGGRFGPNDDDKVGLKYNTPLHSNETGMLPEKLSFETSCLFKELILACGKDWEVI